MKEAENLIDAKGIACIPMVDSLTEKMLELNSAEAQNRFLPLLLKTLFFAAQTIVRHQSSFYRRLLRTDFCF
jgi:hypothetical protein